MDESKTEICNENGLPLWYKIKTDLAVGKTTGEAAQCTWWSASNQIKGSNCSNYTGGKGREAEDHMDRRGMKMNADLDTALRAGRWIVNARVRMNGKTGEKSKGETRENVTHQCLENTPPLQRPDKIWSQFRET